jgi:uncharacterized protein
MNFRYAGIALAVGAAIALGSAMGPAASQEPSESHLAAARAAVDAVGMTDEFDNILPQAAMALKNELTQKNPDQVSLISRTVDEKAIALAARRGDLEREAAAAYAQFFSEEELATISEFYSSPTGQKFIETHPRPRARCGRRTAGPGCRTAGRSGSGGCPGTRAVQLSDLHRIESPAMCRAFLLGDAVLSLAPKPRKAAA